MNKADGNCAFDAVINNINDRACFSEKLPLESTVYRQIWITELEIETEKYPILGAGYTEEERKENWNLLKHSGIYEVDFFGDLVLHAIAKGCQKNILIFNTSKEAPDPIYVIKAAEFGGNIDTEIPVVVGYNQVHYESLHPATEKDIEKTKLLVNAYTNGSYSFDRVEYLSNILPRKIKDQNYDMDFPALQTKNKKLDIMTGIKDNGKVKPRRSSRRKIDSFQFGEKPHIKESRQNNILSNEIYESNRTDQTTKISNEQLMKKKIKDMSKEERKEYKRIKQAERRSTLSTKVKAKEREQNTQRMASKRSKMSIEEKEEEREQNTQRMASKRSKMSIEEKEEEREQTTLRIRSKRSTMSNEEKEEERKKTSQRIRKTRSTMCNEEKEEERKKTSQRIRKTRSTMSNDEKANLNKKSALRIKNSRRKTNQLKDSDDRVKLFKKAVKYGPIFICCSCDQLMFENGVSVFDEETKQKIEEKFKERFSEIFRDTLEAAEYEIKKKINEKPERYLCFTCKKNLLNGKIPSMAVANGLSLIKSKIF